ncbi:MAG: Gfo/Idh/MocA family oxidoreductase [Planctomycetaceae bacterium]|jgi:predicted dehydrogenase|nr:Gfo/Idh/MocA family oxidoreductase [Rhodospirillales bacterium]MBT4844495.1 Gfo/Idh/MocA family oxidoreductase [Planctomycetaceae bacterium]MBT4039737.1 Gfo/Idh/MocA family oxidoreductase [Rhodospirillales bacterium]MBT4626146.1 Gfo/Idh/MocA family oxidoreductase [Rhodospirillales bacterium]MBT5522286.1 Gfo/Idh/MocA family oxidoreductase [Rhodospirillales bacterium]
MLSAAIVGFGAIAGGHEDLALPMTHSASYKIHSDRVQVVAIAEPDTAQHDAIGKVWPVARIYESAEALIADETIDIVSLCGSPSLTQDFFADPTMTDNLKGVWCEKPVALSVNQLDVLATNVSPTLPVQINVWRRFVPEIAELTQQLMNGDFGKVHQAVAYYAKYISDNGVHIVDLAHQCLGELSVRFIDDGTDQQAPTVFAVNGDGAGCTFLPVPRDSYNIFELDILCELGRVRIAENGRRIELQAYQQDGDFPHLQILEPARNTIKCDWKQSFDSALGNLLDHVQNQNIPLASSFAMSMPAARFAVSCTS